MAYILVVKYLLSVIFAHLARVYSFTLCAFSPCCHNVIFAQTLTDLMQKLSPEKSCEIQILRTSKFIIHTVNHIKRIPAEIKYRTQ